MSSVSILHGVGLATAVLCLYHSVRLVSRRVERPIEVLIWSAIGTVLTVVIVADLLLPQSVLAILRTIGARMGLHSTETVLIVAVVGLTLFVVYTYTLVHGYQRRLVETHQELALLRQELIDRDQTNAEGRSGTVSNERSREDD